MFSLTIPVWMLVLHFIADFLLQTDQMAIQKAKSWKWLTYHVLVYSAVFTGVLGYSFGLVTFITHFVTDAITSRWSRRLYPLQIVGSPGSKLYFDWEGKNGRSRHYFFCVIGLDQVVHYITLALTYRCFQVGS